MVVSLCYTLFLRSYTVWKRVTDILVGLVVNRFVTAHCIL